MYILYQYVIEMFMEDDNDALDGCTKLVQEVLKKHLYKITCVFRKNPLKQKHGPRNVCGKLI